MFVEKTNIIDSHWSVNQLGFEEMIKENLNGEYVNYLSDKISVSFRQLGFTRKFKYDEHKNKLLISICDNNRFYGKIAEDVVIYFHKAKLVHVILNKLFNPKVKWIKSIEFIPVARYGIKPASKGILVDHKLYLGTEGRYECYEEILRFLNRLGNIGEEITYITNDGFSKKPGDYLRTSKIEHDYWLSGLAKNIFFLPTHQESGGLTMLEHLIQGGVILIYKELLDHLPMDNYKLGEDYFIFEDETELSKIISKAFKPSERALSFRERYYSNMTNVVEYLYEV